MPGIIENESVSDIRWRIENDGISEKELQEWFMGASPGDIEKVANPEMRHRKNATHWDSTLWMLRVSRPFAFATKDDSWGEFEKLFCIIFRNMVTAKQKHGIVPL